MNLPAAKATDRLLGLDALRGIAALCVVFFHIPTVFPSAAQLSAQAYLAVDFFFVLSGFVMARAYEPKLQRGMSGERFFRARYRRLWPTIAVGCLLFIPYVREAAGGFTAGFFSVFVLNILLLPALGEKEFFPLNSPAWSIFFELVANLVHGLLLWRLGSKFLLAIILTCLAGLVWQAQTIGNLDVGAGQGEFLAGLLRVGFSYTTGILIWRHWGERRVHWAAGVFALLAMPIMFGVPLGAKTDHWLFDVGFVALASPLILICGLAIRGGGRAAVAAGELSFPLYATHFPMLYIGRDLGLGAVGSVFACVIVAGMVAAVQVAWKNRKKQISTP